MTLLSALRRSSPSREELEVYRDLYTRVLLRSGQKSWGVVLGITSATPGEGKTTTALNLARAFAEDRHLSPRNDRGGRSASGASAMNSLDDSRWSPDTAAKGLTSSDVLIIDCNAGRVRASHELAVTEFPGITDYLTGPCPIEDIIRDTDTPYLKVMPVGEQPDALTVLIGTDSMRDLMEAVRKRFALVVVDLPAALAGADTQAMAPLVDHLLFVVRSGKVSQRNLVRALELVERQRVIGTVLNDRRRVLPNWIEQLL